MPIKNDLSGLPSASGTSGGWQPDPDPIFGPALVEWWKANDGDREAKRREYVRPSDAGKCARALSHVFLGTDGEPMDPGGWFNTRVGSWVHTQVQAAALERWGDECIVEEDLFVEVPITDADGTEWLVPVRCFVDLRLFSESEGIYLATDYKTVGGFAYKMAVGERGTAEGPKHDHMLQSAMGALASEANGARIDRIGVCYFAKDGISKAILRRKGFDEWRSFTAEWTAPLDDWREAAQAELLRMWKINRLVHEQGLLAARRVPGVPAEIDGPRDGSWQHTATEDGQTILLGSGNYWGCDYCSYRQNCITEGAGRVSIATFTTGTPS